MLRSWLMLSTAWLQKPLMANSWKWYVYIIECGDGLFYTGMTWNIEKRMEHHIAGLGSKFTSRHGFKAVRWIREFDNLLQARECERRVKDYSRKKKRQLWENHYRSSDSENSYL